MGCDIHAYREKFVGDRWVTADEWESYDYGDDDKGHHIPYEKRAYTGRNYQLFGTLSKGVRSENALSFEPRGIPWDVCEEVARESEGYGVDGHSHSYLYLHELRQLRRACDSRTLEIEGMKDAEGLAALRKSIDSGSPDWNLLFPYCAWSTGRDHQEFKLDVPMAFYIGSDLDRIISSFEGIEGENHRLVFFFDN